ncbi:MAG: hypothetical protein GY731_13930 [Gammaproteobacteria bacterium]|nr:hypothetical protein [Gammaproteobacteria bacterium]
MINYTGHGGITSWVTTGYSASNINALANNGKLPIIFSVACQIGNFNGKTCFCESWLRATNNNQPSGAVVHYGSSIDQDWAPPMQAQDEFNHLITQETYATVGAYYYAASCSMMDKYGSGSSSSGTNMFNTWHIFGDPSLNLDGSDGGGEPPPPPPPSGDDTLTNGQTVSNLSASSGQWVHYKIDVPQGASNLTVQISGGSGDADLYTRFNAAPTTSS